MLNQIADFGQKFRNTARFTKSPDESPVHQKHSRVSNKRLTKFGNSFISNRDESSMIMNSVTNNPKDLATKIKKLYNVSILSFVNQVASNSNKQSHH